jgi:DNA-binding NarL/FixJ family response regulator
MEVLRRINAELQIRFDFEQQRLRRLLREKPATARKSEPTPANSEELAELTPRELEVLKCVAEGCSTKETATRLGIRFKTAACHRHRVMQKLNVHESTSLVRLAIRHKLVPA